MLIASFVVQKLLILIRSHLFIFAFIYSHCEGCLFTLLVVSLFVQMLLSLIRSHLFIYVFISITLGGGS